MITEKEVRKKVGARCLRGVLYTEKYVESRRGLFCWGRMRRCGDDGRRVFKGKVSFWKFSKLLMQIYQKEEPLSTKADSEADRIQW